MILKALWRKHYMQFDFQRIPLYAFTEPSIFLLPSSCNFLEERIDLILEASARLGLKFTRICLQLSRHHFRLIHLLHPVLTRSASFSINPSSSSLDQAVVISDQSIFFIMNHKKSYITAFSSFLIK